MNDKDKLAKAAVWLFVWIAILTFIAAQWEKIF